MTRVLAGISLSAILVFCSTVAADRGLASLYAHPGKSSLALWRAGKHSLLLYDWNVVRSSLEKGLSYDGHNPDLLHELGAAHEAEVAYFPPGATAAGNHRDTARKYYLESLAGRPTWPHDWIDLALVDYRLDRINGEFYQAMHQALTLGPWESRVQYVAADIGMHHWYKFDDEMKNIITGVIHDGIRNRDNAMTMLKLVGRYDMLELACGDDNGGEEVRKYCEHYQRHLSPSPASAGEGRGEGP